MKTILTAVIALIITTSSFAQTGVKKKYNIIMANPCHWWLASKTFTIMGYVLINDGNTSYFTLNGEEIDQSKTPVIRYCRLQRRHSRNKCYNNTETVGK